MRSKRNPTVELYRCLLMVGIVCLHIFGLQGPHWWWLSYALLFCVDGFVFISGYYGIRFRFSKLLGLYGIAFYAGVMIALFNHEGLMQIVPFAHRHVCDRWFFKSYLILMLMAPLINEGMDGIRARYDLKGAALLLAPVFVLAFGWSYLASFNFLKPFVPTAPGLGTFTPLTLVGVYLVGRLVRLYDIGQRFSFVALLGLACLLLPIGCLRLSWYNSPMAVCLAAVSFMLFSRLRLKEEGLVARIAFLVAPSTFAIYMMHSSFIVQDYCKAIICRLTSIAGGEFFPCLLIVSIVYLGAFGLDLIRRIVVWGGCSLGGRLLNLFHSHRAQVPVE